MSCTPVQARAAQPDCVLQRAGFWGQIFHCKRHYGARAACELAQEKVG
jgi:hypothetical protein